MSSSSATISVSFDKNNIRAKNKRKSTISTISLAFDKDNIKTYSDKSTCKTQSTIEISVSDQSTTISNENQSNRSSAAGQRRKASDILSDSTKHQTPAKAWSKERHSHSSYSWSDGASHSKSGQVHSALNNSELSQELVEANSHESSLRLDPFNEGYNVRSLLENWRELPQRLRLTDWSFYVKGSGLRSRPTQIEQLVIDICTQVLCMRQLKHFSIDSCSNCFLWVSHGSSARYVNDMKKGSHIVGRLFGDILLKDKQCLTNGLDKFMFNDSIGYKPHRCRHKSSSSSDNISKFQSICVHQYRDHRMSACTNRNCPNSERDFCECFNRQIFIPESRVFSHDCKFEQFLKEYETDPELMKTAWLAKPAYLTAGKGLFLIRRARDLRWFYQVRSSSCVRREGYVLQRYLSRPMLINNRKADCRMFLLVIVLNGGRVCGFFHPGFTRVACSPWKSSAEHQLNGDIFQHLTNSALHKIKADVNAAFTTNDDADHAVNAEDQQVCTNFNDAVDRMHPAYSQAKLKGKPQNIQAFIEQVDKPSAGVEKHHGYTSFHLRVKFIIEALCTKLEPNIRDKPGTFQIFGLDILIDSDCKPWLLEVNSHVATETTDDPEQAQILSNVVTEAICIMVETLQKSIQEEQICIEIERENEKLSHLNRAQRMMTARDDQTAIDELKKILGKTEISEKNPPIFMSHFLWWYETKFEKQWRPWLKLLTGNDSISNIFASKLGTTSVRERRMRAIRSMPWYSRMFYGLQRSDRQRPRKSLIEAALQSENMREYPSKHLFNQEKLAAEAENYERNVTQRFAELFRTTGKFTLKSNPQTEEELRKNSNSDYQLRQQEIIINS